MDAAVPGGPVTDVEDVVAVGVWPPSLRMANRNNRSSMDLLPPEPRVTFDRRVAVFVDNGFAALTRVLVITVDVEQL